jgi:hypothetical protein
MFNPAAHLALLHLLLAFLMRPFQPRAWRALERMEQVLADALRATLLDAGVAVPDLSNAKLIAWFNAHGPCSDNRAIPGSGKARDRVPSFRGPLPRRAPLQRGHARQPHSVRERAVSRRIPNDRADSRGRPPARAPPVGC